MIEACTHSHVTIPTMLWFLKRMREALESIARSHADDGVCKLIRRHAEEGQRFYDMIVNNHELVTELVKRNVNIIREEMYRCRNDNSDIVPNDRKAKRDLLKAMERVEIESEYASCMLWGTADQFRSINAYKLSAVSKPKVVTFCSNASNAVPIHLFFASAYAADDIAAVAIIFHAFLNLYEVTCLRKPNGELHDPIGLYSVPTGTARQWLGINAYAQFPMQLVQDAETHSAGQTYDVKTRLKARSQAQP